MVCLIDSSKMGQAISTLWAVLRVIISADEIYNFIACPVPKQYTLECSKNLPTMLRTVMFSVLPRMPGNKQQIPLMISCTVTPACDASDSLSIKSFSVMAFDFIIMLAGWPVLAFS